MENLKLAFASDVYEKKILKINNINKEVWGISVYLCLEMEIRND